MTLANNFKVLGVNQRKILPYLYGKSYNVNEISNYTNSQYAKGKYDKIHTEYRVEKLLGE